MLFALGEAVMLQAVTSLTFKAEAGEIRRELGGLEVEEHANGLYP